jgi:regulator of replication initiation timing
MKYSTERSSGGNHLAIKELFSNVTNFTKSLDITLFTAHQLNRKAKELITVNKVLNAVKHFTEEHLADSTDVHREVDVSIFMHIEANHDDVSFLTAIIRKHRYEDNTPNAHKYCAYPFYPNIGIIDDVDGRPGFTSDIYAYTFNQAGVELADSIAIKELLAATEPVPTKKVVEESANFY